MPSAESDKFEVKVGMLDHLKTRKLERECGAEGVLCLLRLWAYATVNHPSGAFPGFEAADLELVARWVGDPGLFGDALLRIGWVDEIEGGLALHDWADEQPWVVSRPDRVEQARKAGLASGRARRQQAANQPRTDSSTGSSTGGQLGVGNELNLRDETRRDGRENPPTPLTGGGEPKAPTESEGPGGGGPSRNGRLRRVRRTRGTPTEEEGALMDVVVETWNRAAEVHELPTVRGLPPRGSARFKDVLGFVREAEDLHDVLGAVERMAETYSRMKREGSGTHTLWNGVRQSNRGKYLGVNESPKPWRHPDR